MKLKLNIDKNAEERVEATVKSQSDFTDKLEELVYIYNGSDRITAYSDDGIKHLAFADIEYITVIDSKTYAFDVKGKQNLIKQRLYEVESILPATFFRINKSSVANRTHIEKYAAAFSGGIDVVFKSGNKEYVSRRCFAQIKKELKSK